MRTAYPSIYRFSTTLAVLAGTVGFGMTGTASAQTGQVPKPVVNRSAISGSLQRSGPVGYRVRAEVVRLNDNPATPQKETDAHVLAAVRYEVTPLNAPQNTAPLLVGATGPDTTPNPAAAGTPPISLTVTDDSGAAYQTRDFFLTDEQNAGSRSDTSPLFNSNSAQAVLELLDEHGVSRIRPGATRLILNIGTTSGSQTLSYKLAQSDIRK